MTSLHREGNVSARAEPESHALKPSFTFHISNSRCSYILSRGRMLMMGVHEQNGEEGGRRSKRQRLELERVDVSHKFVIPDATKAKPVEETNDHRISQRQKQIDYGKNTLGYERYTECIPRSKRTRADPATPLLQQVCSKRAFDGQVKVWRKMLHYYDPPEEKDEEVAQILGHPVMESQAKAAVAEHPNSALVEEACRPTGMIDEGKGWEVDGNCSHRSKHDRCREERKEQQIGGNQESIRDGNREDVEGKNGSVFDIYRDWEDD